jgi:ketosteroid isomerase-like protein
MDKNVELIKELYAAIGSGDLPAVLGRMSEDVEIHLPGPPEIPFAGTFRGHAGVGQFFQALGTSVRWDDRQLEAREFIAQDDQVVVLGHETLTAEPTGRSWDTDWAMVWTVRDGKVVALREFHQTDAIAAAYR